MKLGDVLKKERDRKRLTEEDVAGRLGISVDQYQTIEAGNSPAEEWGPRLALVAIALETPTSRLIAETGKSAQAKQEDGQCGKLIQSHRERRGLSQDQLAEKIQVSLAEMQSIESGESELENIAPVLLSFSEVIEQPIFNLFYPCGLPLSQLTDYP